jgi:hypothetical protein
MEPTTKQQIKLRANRVYYQKNRARICMRSLQRYRGLSMVNSLSKFSIDHGDIIVRFD